MSDLEAIEAIRQLKARYIRLMDAKQWDEFGDQFTDDAELHVVEDLELQGLDPELGIARGRDAIVKLVSNALEGATTAHQARLPEIELTGPDSATGIWSMSDRIWFPAGSAVRELEGYGHYREQYERGGDGRWRIKRLELNRIRVNYIE